MVIRQNVLRRGREGIDLQLSFRQDFCFVLFATDSPLKTDHKPQRMKRWDPYEYTGKEKRSPIKHYPCTSSDLGSNMMLFKVRRFQILFWCRSVLLENKSSAQ